jgi:nucleoside-diphosphate-sugar epimerase
MFFAPERLKATGVTVIGARGFLGSQICRTLTEKEIPFRAVGREPLPTSIPNLGVVIYCAGRAGNFLDDPADTVDGHAGLLIRLVTEHAFSKLVYLSSTRLYRNSPTTREDSPISVNPSDPGSLYDIAKLLGEQFTLTQTHGKGIVLRVSTVIDPDFRSRSLLRSFYDAASEGAELRLRTPPDAARDLIDVGDVVSVILGLAAESESNGVYNVASGINVSNEQIAAEFRRFRDFAVDYSEADFGYHSPTTIETAKLVSTLDFRPSHPIEALERCLAALRYS